MLSAQRAYQPYMLLFATRSPPSPSQSAAQSCVPLSSDTFVVCSCHCLPSPLLSTTAKVIRRCHLPPPQPSLPLRCLYHLLPPALVLPGCSLLPLILHAVVICHRRGPPLPSFPATAIINTPLSPLSLTACSRPFPLQSTTQSCMSLSCPAILIHHQRLCHRCNSSHLSSYQKILIVALWDHHNRLFVMVLMYLRMDFWQNIDRIAPPLPPAAFSDPIHWNREKEKTKTKKMLG